MNRLQVLLRRRASYKETFKSERAVPAMKDLARFCRANQSTFDPDPYRAAMLAGRQEVFNRIRDFINISDSEVQRLKEAIDE